MQQKEKGEERSWLGEKAPPESINLNEVFASPTLTIIELLEIDGIAEEARKENDLMTEKLLSKVELLKELIVLCITPEEYGKSKGATVTKEHTYKALEILTNLNEQFAEYLLSTPPLPEDTVITDQPESPPLISILFNSLQADARIGETALSYIYKIGTSCCYHNPQQIIKLFGEKENVVILGKHFYSGSVMEWVIKILEAEESSNFYEGEKAEIWKWVVNGIENETDELLKADKIENYDCLMTTLLEKIDDRYDKGKYINLARLIFAETFPTQFLISNLSTNQSPHLLKVILQILQKYLHFSTNYRTNISLLNISTNKSGSNLGVGMFSQNSSSHALDVSINSEISLNQEQITKIKEFLINTTKNEFHVSKFGSKIGTIAFLGLFRSLMISLDQNDSLFIEKIMTEDFVRRLIGLLCLTNSCNILHNHVKDILILSTNKNYSYFVPLLLGNGKTGLMEVMNQIKGKMNSNENEYENQLFHVFMNIAKKSEDANNVHIFEETKKKCAGFDEIFNKIKEKEKFYSTLIGGNPRKESSYWGDSSQEEKILTFSFPNQQKNDNKINDELAQDIIGKVEHWIECDDLPLDSDSSRDDLVSSQTFSKEDEDGYEPLSIVEEKGTEENGGISLSQKLRNVGVVECEEEEIRVQKRKKKYSGTYKTGASTELKRKEDKVKENSLESGNKSELKDQQEIELEREIQILEAKRLKRADGDDEDDSPEIKIKIKNTVDSIDDDDSKGEVLGGRKIEGMEISGLMDFSQEKSKDALKMDEEEDQGNLGILSNGSLPEEQETEGIRKEELKAETKEKSNQPIITTESIESDNKAKHLVDHPEGEQGWNNHFPKYLTFQVEEILSELDQYL